METINPKVPTVSTRISTRSKTKNTEGNTVKGKRKADASPVKQTGNKRSALGDLTNAISKTSANLKSKTNCNLEQIPKPTSRSSSILAKVLPPVKTIIKSRPIESFVPLAPINKPQTRYSLRNVAIVAPNQTAQKPKEDKVDLTVNKVKTRLSHEFEKNEDTLYCTALEDVNVSTGKCQSKIFAHNTNRSSGVSYISQQLERNLNINFGNHEVPEGVIDFDKENWNDIFQISHYSMDIFNYLKSREVEFTVPDYMPRQICLSKWMRSLLVDWMVDVQESFELNHETLYLGVKLVDLYLSKVTVGKETLQLVGAAAMFVASKYDERVPPLVDDFLYICDGAYKRKELLRMEINLLKICDFDLGLPLSYRFLRRYARCAKVTMPILTLARYILEYSLMDYATVVISESKLAAATLYMAIIMKNIGGWTNTLQFYTGYKLQELLDTVLILNGGLHRKQKEQLMTVRNKYSHKIFYEVAKIPLISDEDIISTVCKNNETT